MPEQDLIQLARENVEAWTEGNWQRLRAALAPDVVYDEVGTQRRLQGADQLIKVYQDWKKAGPDGKGTVTKAIASGDTVVLEVTWKATQNGPLETPSGIVPPSGKQWSIQAAQVIKIQNGKIKEPRRYFDMLTLLQQIGAAPAQQGARRA